MSEPTKPGAAGRMAELVLDAAAMGGAGLITWGVHLIYNPAGFITAGTFLLCGAWLAARKS